VRPKKALSTAVVEAVATSEGVEPTELTEPLYTAINGDALDALFQTTEGRVEFEYHGYTVRVDASGDVELFPLATE